MTPFKGCHPRGQWVSANISGVTAPLKERLETAFLAPDAERLLGARSAFAPLASSPQANRIGNALLWPLAVIMVIHRVFFLAINGSVTDDFSTVFFALKRFRDGAPVYSENYQFVDPHYLYNPGATLLLSPMGLLDHFFLSRTLFICGNAAAIILALALLTRMFGASLKSMAFPLAITGAFLTEAVKNTLVFANINGVLLLVFVGFLWALLSGRNVLAGVLIGLAILVKPLFIPLLFLPLVRMQWSTLITGVAVPAVFNLAGWFFVPGASDYWTVTTPYLKEVRDYSNSSLPGIMAYFGAPGWLQNVLFVVFALAVAAGVILLLRVRKADPLAWACATAGLLLAGVFFLSSLGQMYYSMMLFPLVFACIRVPSLGANPMVWLGFILCLFPAKWDSDRWRDYGRWLNFFESTAGWAILILALSTTAVAWYYFGRKAARTSLSDA